MLIFRRLMAQYAYRPWPLIGLSCLSLVVFFFTVLLPFLGYGVHAVKHEDFRRCVDTAFCRRQRAFADRASNGSPSPIYRVIDSSGSNTGNSNGGLTLVPSRGVVTAELEAVSPSAVIKGAQKTNPHFVVEISHVGRGTVRVHVNEKNPIKPRYEGAAQYALKSADAAAPIPGGLTEPHRTADYTDYEAVEADGASTGVTVRVSSSPSFKVELMQNGQPRVIVNERNLFNFEHYRLKKAPKPIPPVHDPQAAADTADALREYTGADVSREDSAAAFEVNTEAKAGSDSADEEEGEELDGGWEETFKTWTDSKPNGPSSIGVDVTFPGARHVYGIPEHATTLSLRSTRGPDAHDDNAYTEPYRLFNLDVFEHDLDSPMALYGSVPFMVSHKAGGSGGVFWMNPTEMWVDIQRVKDSKLSRSKGDDSLSTRTHWFAESGVLDLFLFAAPEPQGVIAQYTALTGTTAMPPQFAIVYHQCRWNYNDEEDVLSVNAGFDAHDIPYDVIWLDIEHTDSKKYFTWDQHKFPTPADMQLKLAETGNRKLVTIVDPHIKNEHGYVIHDEALQNGYFVKNSYGNDFDGWCWPGSSKYIDHLNPSARSWWSSRFKFDKYIGSTEHLFIWNDMNEPSVFNGPEITMVKDNIHYGEVEHREIHNLYGMLYHMASSDGVRNRTDTPRRPFVLTRAYFSGSQRVGAMWTGDNMSRWDHLIASIPMVLTNGVVGFPFSGADIGGFFGNPDPELLVRWYQLGAYYPFMRAHAHLDAKRREPWLFGEQVTDLIRDAVRARYRLLPLWYTLFHQASVHGTPIVKPMFIAFPSVSEAFSVETQYMVGDSLLICPVLYPRANAVQAFFPSDEVSGGPWYDWHTYAPLPSPNPKESGFRIVKAPIEKIPVFLRSGAIVPTRERARRSSSAMARDPFTLTIAVNNSGKARGELYVDDGFSYDFETKNDFVHREFSFEKNTLSSAPVVAETNGHSMSTDTAVGQYVRNVASALKIERIIILGLKRAPTGVKINVDGSEQSDARYEWSSKNKVLVVHNPALPVASNWSIELI
ncbi:hypothetical protein GQ42DRAFT_56104 [Ramicandelaber brevisporus]|nr:hypothetical protein GQ42DRAFT_56104 [Ramicandelaber brevisporus]